MKISLGVVLVALVATACRASSASPYAEHEDAPRDTSRAQELSREAAGLIKSDPARAETLLRQALVADIFYGPAHNNLGVIHLGKDELYEAANEFEWARKLMAGHPDPRTNLALTLERAGQEERAISEYDAALQVFPGYVPALQGRTSLHLRRGGSVAEVEEALHDIALRGTSEEWRMWARERLAGNRPLEGQP